MTDGNPAQAPPRAGRISVEDIQAAHRRASAGSVDDLHFLAEWALCFEAERHSLVRKLRRQEHDFTTIFEIVSQTGARSLNVLAMQAYLLRTVSGHFAAPKVMILRKLNIEDSALTASAAQCLGESQLRVPLVSALCGEALLRRACFFLNELPAAVGQSPETAALRALGLDLAVPLVLELERAAPVLEGLLLLGPRLAGKSFGPHDLDFLNMLGHVLAISFRNEALYRRSIVDDLTGVSSRGHFDACLAQEVSRAQRYGHANLGLIMLDVDLFKFFNDRHGHQTGDRILRELARTLVSQVRGIDIVARYGGEEFAIIVLEIERPRLGEICERLRRAVAEMRVLSDKGDPLSVTISLGGACLPEDATDRWELIQKADMALYAAKDAGRNRYALAAPREGTPPATPQSS